MTPLQELIREIELNNAMIHNESWLNSMIEKEKQMVIDAYDTNITESLRSDRINIISGEQYYKDNFKL